MRSIFKKKQFARDVRNTFFAAGNMLQVLQSYLVGAVAQSNLVAGFFVLGRVYAIGRVIATWPVRVAQPAAATGSN